MKQQNPTTLVLLCVLALIGLTLSVWVSRTRDKPSPNSPAVVATSQGAIAKSTVLAPSTVADTYSMPGGGEYRGLEDERWVWWKHMEGMDPKFEWKMAMDFFGVVQETDGRPVPGARVRFEWTDLSRAGVREHITYSDASGHFSLTGQSGKNLGVYVTHDNYHALNGGRGTFEYAAFFESTFHQPDRTRPVVFRLLKKTVAEPLLVRAAPARLSYDNAEYFFDFDQGAIGRSPLGGSGLRFTIARAPSPQGQPFDWSFRVSGVSATIRQTTDEFPQNAPSDGYAEEWEASGSATSPKFQWNCSARLYFRTSDGHFGWVDVELMQPNARELGPKLMVTSYLNPSGSRNVEYDRTKAILPR